MIQCHGYKNGKYQIFETDPTIELDFQGVDKDKFEQINPPIAEKVQRVKFDLPIQYLKTEFPGFLPNVKNRSKTRGRLRNRPLASR